jgi:hypothetical protein
MELLALLFILAFATAVLLSRKASYRESRWATYHHLFEYGTIPIFVTIGRLHRAPFVHDDGSVRSREVFMLRYTYDERVEDGFYAARPRALQALLEEPERLIGMR